MTDEVDRPVIVVGVDGSAASKRAVRWAARQAELSGGQLEAVLVWHLPEVYGYTPRDYAGDARKVLDEALADALGPEHLTGLAARVVEGRPAATLIEASRHADLLAVGAHGHGAFEGMLLGSVSEHCVHHAECPVVVVRTRRGEKTDDGPWPLSR